MYIDLKVKDNNQKQNNNDISKRKKINQYYKEIQLKKRVQSASFFICWAHENFKNNLQNQINHNNIIKSNQENQNKIELYKNVLVEIKNLINQSSNSRHIDENLKRYLQPQQNEQHIFQHYSIRQISRKKSFLEHFRDDGNSLYHSFGYQFLKIVIYEYTDEEFNEFLNNYFSISFQIQFKEIKIPKDMQQNLLSHYKDRLRNLRQLEKNNKTQQQLKIQFQAYELNDNSDELQDGYFNPLTVIFLKNLCMHLVEKDYQNLNSLDKNKLLQWQEESNSDQIAIALLAKHLKIHIKLITFYQDHFVVGDYSPEYQDKKRSIILLYQPGLYNIGINSDNK